MGICDVQLSKAFEEGMTKYTDRLWKESLPTSSKKVDLGIYEEVVVHRFGMMLEEERKG